MNDDKKNKTVTMKKNVRSFAVKEAKVIEDVIPEIDIKKKSRDIAAIEKRKKRIVGFFLGIIIFVILFFLYLQSSSVITRLYNVQGEISKRILKIIEDVSKDSRFMIPVYDYDKNKDYFTDSNLAAVNCYDKNGYGIVDNIKQPCAIVAKYFKIRVENNELDSKGKYIQLSKIFFLFEYNSFLDDKIKDKKLRTTRVVTELIR